MLKRKHKRSWSKMNNSIMIELRFPFFPASSVNVCTAVILHTCQNMQELLRLQLPLVFIIDQYADYFCN